MNQKHGRLPRASLAAALFACLAPLFVQTAHADCNDEYKNCTENQCSVQSISVTKDMAAPLGANGNDSALIAQAEAQLRDAAGCMEHCKSEQGACESREQLQAQQVAMLQTQQQAQRQAADNDMRLKAEAALARPGTVLKDCDICPEMVVVPAGSFDMGSDNGEVNEKPVRRVTVPTFAMAKTEVTQGQWRAIMGSNPSFFKNCDNCPVESVNWKDAQAFVNKLSEKTGKTYRLPSEAEWEYAARAGSSTQYWWGDAASREYMNYGMDRCCRGHANGNDRWKEIAPVTKFPANPFGLHDMNGNVWEWTQDCYHDSHSGAPADGSSRSSSGDCTKRVLRGGSWDGSPRFTRTAYRVSYPSSDRVSVVGFRPVRVIAP